MRTVARLLEILAEFRLIIRWLRAVALQVLFLVREAALFAVLTIAMQHHVAAHFGLNCLALV